MENAAWIQKIHFPKIALHIRDRPTHLLRRARTGAPGGLSILRRDSLSAGRARFSRHTLEFPHLYHSTSVFYHKSEKKSRNFTYFLIPLPLFMENLRSFPTIFPF